MVKCTTASRLKSNDVVMVLFSCLVMFDNKSNN